jgi:putative phosphoesterase
MRQRKPLLVVRGNNDVGLTELPETVEAEIEGKRLAIIHDSGSKDGRGKRMKKRFPNADIVVFGHSHMPMVEEYDGLLLFNPGSPTDKRRQPKATMGLIEIVAGKISPQIIEIG